MSVKRCERRWVRMYAAGVLTLPLVGSPLAWGAASSKAAPHLPASTQMDLLLNSARQAYNDKNFAFAADRFREALRMGPGKLDAAAARYGLGLTLLEGPGKDYPGAIAALTAAAAVSSLPERPYALYHLGIAQRGLAEQGLAQSPPNAAAAQVNLTHAATSFSAAADAFARVLAATSNAPTRATVIDWIARARCDQAEILLRIGRPSAAALISDNLLKDPNLKASRYRPLALYYNGYANFALRSYNAAGRALALLAPFDQPDIGPHVRYLLGRTHHLSGERPEAMSQYQALLLAFVQQRAAAAEALKNPAALKDKPQEIARLQALVNSAPDYVPRAAYYLGLIHIEQGQFEPALATFAASLQHLPNSPVAAETRLQLGLCQVALQKWPEAVATLSPLQDHPALSDQALRQLAKAQLGAAGPLQGPAYAQGLANAIQSLKKASDRLQGLLGSDPEAKLRRPVLLVDLGDMLQRGGQYAEAAAVYAQAVKAAGNLPLAEQALSRQIIALQLAGQYAASDQYATRFQQLHPKSPLLPEVLLRQAENALLTAIPAAPGSEAGRRNYAEAIRRFQVALKQSPEGRFAILAKQGIATAYYQMGQYEQAAEVLSSIPDHERTGDLSSVNYLQADCLLRTLPEKADDALAAAMLIEQLTTACTMFDSFAVSRENEPVCVDPLLKVAYCRQRIADMILDPVEQRTALALARRTCLETYAKFPTHPLAPTLLVQAAQCSAKIDRGPATVAQLAKFQAEPLKSSPIAPLALILLGDSMRATGKSAEAVNLLTQVRKDSEASLLKDPSRSQWVPVLQYSLALALKESGNFAEARQLFQSIAQSFPKRPEATEVIWREAQIQKDQAIAKVQASRQALLAASAPEARAAAQKAFEAALKELTAAAQTLAAQAANLAKKLPDSQVPAHMNYDAAWCWRSIAEIEIDLARRKLQADAQAKLQPNAPPNPAPVAKFAPDIPLAAIALQPAEAQARASYKAVIDAAPASALANDARLELAELHLQRDQQDAAAAVLKELLETDPPQDMADKVRLRVGELYLAKNNPKAALAQFLAVTQTRQSSAIFYAREGAAEALTQLGDWNGVVQQLLPLVQGQPLQVIRGARDRAIFRLAQAYQQLGQVDQARAVLEVLVARFPASPLVHEARLSLGQAYQALKQPDKALAVYAEIPRRTGSELAAKALLQTGLIRLEQKQPAEALKNFLTIVYSYDYPQWTAPALCEAARVQMELKKPAEAKALLQRVLKDHPATPWAELAGKRLTEIK